MHYPIFERVREHWLIRFVNADQPAQLGNVLRRKHIHVDPESLAEAGKPGKAQFVKVAVQQSMILPFLLRVDIFRSVDLAPEQNRGSKKLQPFGDHAFADPLGHVDGSGSDQYRLLP